MQKVERPKTLKESALESLRGAITSNLLKPGDRLVERTLCESMGVSRTVVRECIRHLESERLVVGIPNSGFIVASISDAEVKEIYEIRTLLECSAVKACSQKATPDVIKQLYKLHDEIAHHLLNDDVKTSLNITKDYYELIFKTAEKHVSWDLVEQLNSRISRLRALTLSSTGRKTSGPKDLFDIIKALEKKDSEQAGEICARHLQEAYEIAMQTDQGIEK
ncbi:GntR family transcriptional regulator [Marinomonas foliarum]|uniref:DNA-binding GntR family transcriptional regulator n=1 Tax=Marinomonas foliarum TaxID=491950 RepID=A0A368ZRJ7_9GAMM|nr:GntR family transcriptional regulator [Marinomonas foliarum]RCW99629.1 DNA-binding GntR family transcriptional regulator [Marinomonas foliarum]